MNLRDEIAAAAYELYETRGRIPGRDLDDWLEAERIVLARRAGQEIEEPEEENSSQEGVAAEGEKAKEGEEAEENQESDFE
ncbi:MAG TPA: DUF2934 domain-containing protein [Nitrospirota bacterium]|nr:DUF2934 domain-containing protein [Nitrospirota bacterium]